MNRKTISTLSLLCLVALAVWATYLIMAPFLWPILTAVVFSIAFYPLYARLYGWLKKPGRAALFTVLLVMVAVIAPLTVIAVILADDIYFLVDTINQKSQQTGGFTPFLQCWLDRAAAFAAPVVRLPAADVRAQIIMALGKARDVLLSGVGGFLGNAFALVMRAAVVMVLVYFFLRDGRAIMAHMTTFQLLDREHTQRLFRKVTDTIQASMYGILTVAVAQAIAMGTGLAVLGVTSPVLWGVVTIFASMVPIVGTALVWGPAAVYLFVTAGWMKGAIMVFWGAVVVGGIDSVLRPLIIEGKVQLHPLVLLFALVGGTQVFGILGLFAGPVILAVTLALLDILHSEMSEAGLLGQEPEH
jgi:predicted PurR-regulated permease PerM